MSVDLDVVVRRGLVKGLRNLIKIVVVPHSLDHLLRGHQRKVFGNCGKTCVGDQKYPVPVGIVGALAKFPVQLPQLLFVHMGLVQNGPGHQLKLLGASHAVVGIQPQPSLVVALQHQHVFPVLYGQEEVQHLNVFQATVNIVPHKYVKFVVFDAAVIREVFLQDRIATVNVADMMNTLVG